MKNVIDTNVFVSALMNDNGIPAKILSLLLNVKIKIFYDNRILFEYYEVLSRKKFGFYDEIISGLIELIKQEGEYINAEYSSVYFNDEADKKFYEVFKTSEADYLITGNKKHFPKDSAIVTPREFIEIYKSNL